MSTNGFAGHRIYDAVENNRPTDVDRDTIVRGNHLVTGYLGAGKQALIATENNQAELIFAPQVAQGERYRMKEIVGDANTFKISRSSPQDRPSTTSLVFQQGEEEIAAFDSDMIEFRAPVKVHGELTVVNEDGTDEQAVFEEHLVIESQANLEMKSQTKIVFHDGDAGTGGENPSGADFAIDLVSSALRFYDMEDDNPMMEVRKDKVVISGDLDVEGRLTTVDGHEATFMEKVFFNHDSSNAVSVQELSSAQLYDTADLFQNFKKAKDAYEAADASLQSSIGDLSNLRKAEDDALSVAIAAEAAVRAGADQSLQDALSAEETAREVADNVLQAAIDQEATNRADADTALQANIDDLSNLRKAEDDKLSVAIAAEATSRAAQDTALQSSIDALSNLRKAEDDTLSVAIAAEATSRADADTALQSSIDALSNLRKAEDDTLSVAIAAEATSRADADTALQSSIDALSNLRKVEDDALSVALAADVQDLADKFEKKQVFTLSGSDSEFYVKDGIVPTTVGQLYIDENGFMRVVMPDVSGMSTLNATFDARMAASQSSGSSLDSEFGYTIPEYNSLSSISEYYGFGEASDSNGYLDDASDPLFMSEYQDFDSNENTTFEGAYIEGVATGEDFNYHVDIPTAVGATKAEIAQWAKDNLVGSNPLVLVHGIDFANADESSVTGFVKTNNDQYALISDDNGNKLALVYVTGDGA